MEVEVTRIIGVLLIVGVGLAALAPGVVAQDTFSIVAVDPLTGMVASAGASCISGSIIISDPHPGVGAIHTQSYWNGQNQQYASDLMDAGYSPEEIIDLLVENDAQNNPTIRQYGIVDLVDGGRSAAYTGSNCYDWKGHILGPTYAIQGNILLGPEIVEWIEDGFLTTSGSFADRVMAALQGANVPGADVRCLDDGKSSISAFIRVALATDTPGNYFLDLNVNNTSPGQEPIDILQELFDEWKLQSTGTPDGSHVRRFVLEQNRPNPFSRNTTIRYQLAEPGRVSLRIYDVAGREVDVLVDREQNAGYYHREWNAGDHLGAGVYLCVLRAAGETATQRLLLLKSDR